MNGNPSPSRPWMALAGGVAIVLVLLAALWWTDDRSDAAPPVDRSEPEAPAAASTAPDIKAPLTYEKPSPIPPLSEAARQELEEGEALTAFGWVETAAGERVPNREVNLFDDTGEFLDSAFTDETGMFRLFWDEPLAAGWSLGTEPELTADPLDPDALMPAFYEHPRDQLPGDPPVECRLVLTAAARIEGFVYDTATNQPIELADVEAVSLVPAWIDEFQDTYTEEDGSFTLALVDIPSRQILVRVLDDEDRVAVIGPLDLEPGEVRFLKIGLDAPLVVRGHVRSAVDLRPVDGAEVALLPVHSFFEGEDAWDLSWDDGSWELDPVTLPRDRIWVRVEADELGPTLLHVTEPTQPVEIRLPPRVTIKGRVTEAGSGAPVDGALVRAVLSGPFGLNIDVEDAATTEDDGTFALELETVPPEAAELFVESDDHVRFHASLSTLTTTPGRIEIVLRPVPEP